MDWVIQLPVLFFSVVIHECCHGLAAWERGDDTAERAGRLTLNPLSHVDAFGSVFMPMLCLIMNAPVFGWAKPVPVDVSRLKDPRMDAVRVAAVGPLSNFLLAFAAAAHFSGKRLSVVTTIVVSAGIILTNLLVPLGLVLARIGPFAITRFALTEGIMKALTFEGLMLLSKASIMQGLKIPGRLGGIVGDSFLYYDRIIEYRGRIRASTLSADADAMMSAVWEKENLGEKGETGEAGASAPHQAASGGKGNAILIAVVLAIAGASLLF